ncbi:Acyl-CoA synthetase (NDP forming) [Cribrihabitans marinus]|uniref:Acyl-CoA synthetase (NDP forming) n=1 Tax=Cribrihabitans marinus TaxID=1227549 RepID=A0A1H7DNZ1_9RHOB|nr:acetate--CoA ligase family protein [Cribrihabitans marinus]GGH39303.1 acyl-CoA synthetase [Cribrihabitans marinus]SEK00980.1 Acyl-CoA synthetase (NDP forming) [Cribrihabitans marinus]
MCNLSRLLRPESIAVIGGGDWGRSVIEQCRKMGFSGPIWPVHPSREEVSGLPAWRSVADLPGVPDAAFVGVNRLATIEAVRALSAGGAGGAVCFASGFREASAEDESGAGLQAALLAAAGDMPFLGPNCYGFINYLDGALLWPDQHGGVRTDRGVAIVAQSSNIAINLTMQTRGLPLAYMVTAGNQARCGLAGIGAHLIEDPRVSALGLYIEGIGDLRAFEALAARAGALGKPIVALKVGRSDQARTAAVSHSASLAGSEAGARAFLDRLGIARAATLPEFLETLKLLHVAGPLSGTRIASVSCSGGEAGLVADIAPEHGLGFPPLTPHQQSALRSVLGPMVALANPLDYHTHVWRDVPAMTQVFAAMTGADLAMTLLIADFPRADRCDAADWDCVVEAAIGAHLQTGRPMAVVATLPELMPETVSARLMAAGVVPFSGLSEALAAFAGGRTPQPAPPPPVMLPEPVAPAPVLAEGEAKRRLQDFGLRVPRGRRCADAAAAGRAAAALGGRVVLKGEGMAHKTEAGAVVLNLCGADEVEGAARAMPAERFLVEEMVGGAVAELLIGVVKDAAHGYVLTLGAGGILAELLDDRASVLLPATDAMICDALDGLRIAPLLAGYRGRPPARRDAILAAVRAVADYARAHAATLEEIEINPLICTPDDAVAVDALIRQRE